MTYDNTDTNADGAIDSPIDNELVNTEELNNEISAKQKGGLQSAIDAAGAGDTVVFDHDETIASYIDCKSGIEIRGTPGNTLTIADGSNISAFYVGGVSDITIRDMRVDGNAANQSSGGRLIDGNTSADISGHRIKNNELINGFLDPVIYQAQSAVTIEDIVISGNTVSNGGAGEGHGIILKSKDAGGVVKDIRIADNTVLDHAAIGITVNATAGEATSCTITGNTTHATQSAADQGIALEGNVKRSTITGNTIENTTAQGIALANTGCDNNTVVGNTIDCQSVGILVGLRIGDSSDITVAGNTITTGNADGIRFENSAGDSVIADNAIESVEGDGIHISGVGGNVVEGNNIRSVGVHGIRSNTPDNKIADNRVAFAGHGGIIIFGNDCTVSDNTCKNNDQNGNNDAYSAGICVDGASDCILNANLCFDGQSTTTQDFGINERNSPDWNIVTDNNCHDNGNNIGGSPAGTNGVRSDNIE